MFSIPMLNEIFKTSGPHWLAHIECGKLLAVDLKCPNTTKAMHRIPRAALIAFLEKQPTFRH